MPHTIRRIAIKYRALLAAGLLFLCATITLGQETMGMKDGTKMVMKEGMMMGMDGKMMGSEKKTMDQKPKTETKDDMMKKQ